MSVKVYGKMWLATIDDIADVVLREKVVQQLEPEKEPLRAHRTYASLYARYVLIVNRLGDIYDQTLQVQKRALVRRVLESATLRMVELQTELKNIELSEFMYIDQTLVEEKYTIEDVQLLSPFYYPMARTPAIQDVIDGKRKEPEPVEEDEEAEKKTTMQLLIEEQKRLADLEASRVDPWADAIRLLQTHEKARQARCHYTYIRMHPDIYWPQPPPCEGPLVYKFYYKPDTPMLVPVRRTQYESNYYRKLRTFSHVQFYVNPYRAALMAARQAEQDAAAEAEQVAAAETAAHIEFAADAPAQTPADGATAAAADGEQAMTSAAEPLVDLLGPDPERQASESSSVARQNEEQRARDEQLRARNAAATAIQRCFLLWRIRRRVRERRLQHFVDLSMADRRKWDFRERDLTEQTRRQTVQKKALFDEAFRAACEDTRNRIVKFRTPWIMEDISDHIRAWFKEMWLASEEREFDKFPPAAKGGTILVLKGMTPSPWEFVEFLKRRDELAAMTPEQRKKIADDAKKAKKAEKKARQDEKKKKAKMKADKLKAQAKNGKQWEYHEEEFITKNFLSLEQQMIDYGREWRFVDEFANASSAPYMEWIAEDEYAVLHQELRTVVDELMRVEYELLQMARCVDQKKKYKPPKPPKNKKKGKRGKKPPPPITFGERDVEQVYDDMLEHGAIQAPYPMRRWDEFIGDRNYGAYEMRNCYDLEAMHGHGEVKDVLRHYILGMGDIQMKHPRSLCVIGPPGCGKKFMIDALANDMGVVKFDLSAAVVVRYRDDLKRFVDDVLKMARLMQPSMLFVDGAHQPFIKKMPPELEPLQPRLLAPYLPKLLKAIKPTDRIMLMGTSNEPWNCAVAKLKKCFERVLMCPGADYGTTLLTWRTALLRMEGTDRLMDFSALSKVTQYYGIRQMLDTAERVVDLKRRVFLERRPLPAADLLEDLLTGKEPNFPMDETERLKYQKVFQQTNPLAKARAQARAKKDAAAKAKEKK